MTKTLELDPDLLERYALGAKVGAPEWVQADRAVLAQVLRNQAEIISGLITVVRCLEEDKRPSELRAADVTLTH